MTDAEMDEEYDWRIVSPQPFSKDTTEKEEVKIDRVKFKKEVNGYIFYQEDQVVCRRRVKYHFTIDVILQKDGLWYWKIERGEERDKNRGG